MSQSTEVIMTHAMGGLSTGLMIGSMAGGYGTVIGGVVGLVIGTVVGILAPDPAKTSTTTPVSITVTQAQEGVPLWDALGTVQVAGNIIWQGNAQTFTHTEGGVLKYDYLMTWAAGICEGPIDKLFSIRLDGDLVWHGALDRRSVGQEGPAVNLEGIGVQVSVYATTAIPDLVHWALTATTPWPSLGVIYGDVLTFSGFSNAENNRAVTASQFSSTGHSIIVLALTSDFAVETGADIDVVSEREFSGAAALLLTRETTGDVGTAFVFFGTESQEAPEVMWTFPWSSEADNSNIPDYRGSAYIVFTAVNVGETPTPPSMNATFAKWPELADVQPAGGRINYFDYNPALAVLYIIRERLGLPSSWLDLDSFYEASEVLRAERLGISLLFDQHREARSYLEDILAHIGGLVRYEPEGRFKMVLQRPDQAKETLPVITENEIVDGLQVERKSWLSTVNEVKVNHTLRDVVCGDTLSNGYGDSVGVSCCPADAWITYAGGLLMTPSSQKRFYYSVTGLLSVEALCWQVRTGAAIISADQGDDILLTTIDADPGGTVILDLLCGGEIIDSVEIEIIDWGEMED
ncbi:MAG: hypothetical protein V1816_10940 [Pseudomonadota bacterium]